MTNNGFYRKTAASVTLATGTTYTTTGLAMKKAEVGKVFGEDGDIYDDAAAATTAGTTALALITYMGNDAETSTTYNHGLALALTDANGGSTAKWCSQTNTTCLTSQCSSIGDGETDMAGIANTQYLLDHNPSGHNHDTNAAGLARNYNSGTHPTGTSAWFLPSAGQWKKMEGAAGSASALETNANLLNNWTYWSSTEHSGLRAWYYKGGYGLNWSDKDGTALVRACLAF